MAVRKISVSLDEDVLERATAVAEREGVSLSTWLSRAAAEAADLAAKQEAVREFFALHGEPSLEQMQETYEQMRAEGHFEPESPEHFAKRMAALALLREAPSADEVPAERPAAHRRAG